MIGSWVMSHESHLMVESKKKHSRNNISKLCVVLSSNKMGIQWNPIRVLWRLCNPLWTNGWLAVKKWPYLKASHLWSLFAMSGSISKKGTSVVNQIYLYKYVYRYINVIWHMQFCNYVHTIYISKHTDRALTWESNGHYHPWFTGACFPQRPLFEYGVIRKKQWAFVWSLTSRR